MRMRVLLLSLIIACMLMLGSVVALAQAQDHPVIKPIPGSTLLEDYYVHKAYDSLELNVIVDEELTKKVVKGEYWELQYEFQDESGNRDDTKSGLEAAENYKNAALEKGGKILYDAGDVINFTMPTAVGDTYWVYLEAGDGWYSLYIVKEEGLKQKLHFGADEIKAELDKTGHIAIYGITFEFDKADLQAGAETQLIEIVKLMKNNPGLKIEVQGHTDNVGDEAYNKTLSEKRAQTVKGFLQLYGISSEHITTAGYGESQPVATNDTEEGRGKNRRVEIVKVD